MDADTLAWFRASGPGWNTLVNNVFRDWYDAHQTTAAPGTINGIGGHSATRRYRGSSPHITYNRNNR
jgi:hypothetical protein